MKLELHATPAEVMRAVEALQQMGKEQQVPREILFGLALALEECGTNIVNHALNRDENLMFSVTLEHTGSAVVMELRDSGLEFDQTQAPLMKKDEGSEQSHGGWGITLVRSYIDEIRYSREGDENVLRLIKRVN